MSSWLYRLERKYGRYGISNLMMYIVATMGVVYVADVFTGISQFMYLSRYHVLQGQVWRLVTFVFLPPSLSTGMVSPSGLFWLVIGLWVYYFMGSNLERAMGTFSFNIYYLVGILSQILAAFVSGMATNGYLNMSLLFAFACFFPDTEFRIFFLIPIKVKHLAMINGVFFGLAFLVNVIQGDWPSCISILASILNFLLFFGPDFFRRIQENRKYAGARKQFRRNMRDNDNFWR